MKSFIKKLKYYPVTLTKAVFRENTNENIEDTLKKYDNNFLKFNEYDEKINEYDTIGTNLEYKKYLKNYKGEFVFSNRESLRQGEIGDFWIYNGLERLNLDGNVIFPHSYIYIDTENMGESPYKAFKTIKILENIKFKPKEYYDVVIVGGGAGGIGAAYALKDSGLNIALIEKLDTLGGTHCNAGVGLMIANPVGEWYKLICKDAYNNGHLDFRTSENESYLEVGEGETFEKRWRASLFSDPKNIINGYQGNHLNIDDIYFSQKYYDDLSSTIDIFTNHEVVKVYSSEEKKIYEIDCLNKINGNILKIVGDYFIDSSADGVLFTKNDKLKLDIDYYSGTDGKERFNENVYGEEEPDIYAINTIEPIFYTVQNPYDSTGYIMPDKPKWIKPYSDTSYRANFTHTPPNNNGISMVSYSYGLGMKGKNYLTKDYEWNFSDGFLRAQYEKLKDYNNNGVRQSRFSNICKLLAIRESYRIACDKIVNQEYLEKQITSNNIKEEKIMALSTWYVDIHNQPYYCVSNICNGIPFEATVPKCYTNVLIASRCYGASHIALSSIRLAKTMLDLGYSVGKAMVQIAKNQLNDVREVNVEEVQNETGISNTIKEIESYFYNDIVSYEEVTS